MKYKEEKIYMDSAIDMTFLESVIDKKYAELENEFGKLLYCEFNIESRSNEILSLEYAINDFDKPNFITGKELIQLIKNLIKNNTKQGL